jgi:lactate dehydrogenase-like 2-hydroxyacid dehydrogenase
MPRCAPRSTGPPVQFHHPRGQKMQIAILGLGRMGANMARRLMQGGLLTGDAP